MGAVGLPVPRLDGAGTGEETWRASRELDRLPRWTPDAPPSGRAMIVAPHPDDEILGVGGTWARLADAGVDVTIVAVTDGERSHPGKAAELRVRRPLESVAAAVRLGVPPARTIRLGHPDGGIDEGRLGAELLDVCGPGDLVLAPWDRDGHPDHDQVGRAALAAGRGQRAQVLAYLVWAWHWASPDGGLPWDRALRVDLGVELAGHKRAAVSRFASQLGGPQPILPATALERLTRSFEVLLRV